MPLSFRIMQLEGNLQLQRVLYGLLRYPGLKDTAIASNLDIARSTFGALKAKLVTEGVITPMYYPDFYSLGCELMNCSYMESLREGEVGQGLRQARSSIRELPQMVHVISEGGKCLGLSYFDNFTEFDEQNSTLCHSNGSEFRPLPMTNVLFPLRSTLSLALFDFAGVVNRVYELGFSDPYPEIKLPGETASLPTLESQRKLMVAMVNQPQASEREYGKVTGLSLPTVAKARKEILKQGLLRPRWLPSTLKTFGTEMLAMVHAKLDPTVDVIQRIQTLKRLLSTMAPFFFVAKASDLIILAPFRSFSQYQDCQSLLLDNLWSQKLLLEPPRTVLVEIAKVEPIKHFAFMPLIERLFARMT